MNMTETYITQELFVAKLVLYGAILIGISIIIPMVYNLIKVYTPRFIISTFKIIYEDVPVIVKGLFAFLSICFLVQPNKEWVASLGGPMLILSLTYAIASTLYSFNNIADIVPKRPVITNAIKRITSYYSIFNWVKCCSCEDYIVREVLWEVDISLIAGWIPLRTEFVCRKCAPKKKSLKRFFSEEEYFALKTSLYRIEDEKKTREEELDRKYGLADDYDYNYLKDM
jgi:hypothetical protein